MRIYLSGKISGLSKQKYTHNFRVQRIEMQKRYPDARIVNPLEIAKRFNLKRYFWQMAFDIWFLLWCDAISMQTNWMDSRGATIEFKIAVLMNKDIIYL